MNRSPELEELVVAWFDGASRGDASLVDAYVSRSDGTRLIGSAPAEDFRGGTAVAEFLRGEVEGAAGKATFSPKDVEAFSEGTVGCRTASTCLRAGVPCSIRRTVSGSSSRPTRRSARE